MSMNYKLCTKRNSEIFNFRKKLKIRNSYLHDEILKSLIIEVEGRNLVWMILLHLLNHKWYRTPPLPTPSFTPPPTHLSKIFSNWVRSQNLVWMMLINMLYLLVLGTPKVLRTGKSLTSAQSPLMGDSNPSSCCCWLRLTHLPNDEVCDH